MSLQALTNIQIDEYYKNESRYGGCFSTDILNKIGKNQYKFYILNLDSSRGPGTHFVLLSLMDKDVGIYFDSYALSPPEQVVRYMKKYRTENIRNIGQIQQTQASSCGFFACYIADMLMKGRTFVDIISDFDTRGDLRKNDMILKKYFFSKK